MTLHDDLRPLLMPDEEDLPVLPDPLPEATPEEGIAVADEAIAVLETGREAGAVGESVIAAMNAAKDYFEAAKSDLARRPGLVKRELRAVGGTVALIVGAACFAASMTSIHARATAQG